ncbi:CRISPR-associated endonuclease Cas1 [Brachyspira alvinipulli]|uniref:CRISPR-associated endonuclease Cas1 n=1 Tax=Brachyspira alvinipulli TaxID=84379 RepID=UPI00048617C1|nr:CRISPR-associated endonuclease Cas1 [Brachyspira alvinipulli]
MILYITNKDYKLAKKYNTLEIKDKENNIKTIPIEKINKIIVYGKKAISSQLIFQLLKKNISMVWFSKYGNFLGVLNSNKKVKINLLKKQFILNKDYNFCLHISKIFITSKIKNCRMLLYKYNRKNNNEFVEKSIKVLNSYINKINISDNIESIMGYEGNSAKIYFKCLNYFLPEDFNFQNRNKKPPKDPFNSLLSFGYTLLFYEIYNNLEYFALNTHIGFMHKLRNDHPSLVSDLMEEFRSPIIDSIIIAAVRKKIFIKDDFEYSSKNHGVYLKNKSVRKLIKIFEDKMNSRYNKKTFREILLHQSYSLYKSIKEKNPELYKGFIIR